MRSKYMEERFQKMLGNAPVKEKEPYKMPKVSKKQMAINREVSKIVKNKKKVSTGCQVHSPVCRPEDIHSHHLQGRIGKKATDPDLIVLACDPCNSYIEDNDEWARDNGWKQTKHDPNYDRNKIKNS